MYTVMSISGCLYGIETWTMKNAHKSRLQSADMRFLRSVAEYTRLDRKKYEDICHELAVRLVNDMVREYRQKLFDHVERMALSLIHI